LKTDIVGNSACISVYIKMHNRLIKKERLLDFVLVYWKKSWRFRILKTIEKGWHIITQLFVFIRWYQCINLIGLETTIYYVRGNERGKIF